MKHIMGGACVFVVAWSVHVHATEQLQLLTIQLHWIPNVEFAGLILAKEHGWYEEAGIDLRINAVKSGIVSVDEVLAGRAHIGVAEGATLIEARADRKPVKAIAAQFQTSPQCLISKKDLGIDGPEKLVGKKVGIKNTSGVTMLTFLLASQGLSFEDIIPIRVGLELQPLIDDEIDVFSGYLTNEPLLMKALGYEVNVIPAYQYGFDFYGSVYFVQEAMLEEQPDVLEKFLKVTFRGWREAFRDPVAAAQCIVEHYYSEGEVQQQTEELKLYRFLATRGVGEKLFGFMQDAVWTKGIEILYQSGQIDHKIAATELFSLELLKRIYSKQ